MKKIKIGTVLLLISFTILAQNETDKILNLHERPLKHGDYYINTIFNKMNYSSPFLQDFLQNQLHLEMNSEQIYTVKNGYGTITYSFYAGYMSGPAYSNINPEDYSLHVKYTVFLFDKDFFVEKMDIWGNWEYVATVFVKYLPGEFTKDNLQKRDEESMQFMNDKWFFSSYYKKGEPKARIEMRHYLDGGRQFFLREFKKKKAEYENSQAGE